jgi:predicted ribonuclease YlaK
MIDLPELAVPSYLIDSLYETGTITVPEDCKVPVSINQYVILFDESNKKHSTLARYIGNSRFIPTLSKRSPDLNGIKPKDAKQASFIDSLLAPEIILSIAIGSAGTGKTTLALAYAAECYKQSQKPIFLCKPTTKVGNSDAFGTVPGDVQEKYDPYLASYKIVLKKIFGEGGVQYFESMQKNGHLQYIPIELARGCTYDNCTFILDEAQNLNWHELNTIVSRMGENTELIILGDIRQIDSGLSVSETGLHKFVTSMTFKKSSITSAIELKTQYRSPITKLVAEVDEELRRES